MPVLSEMKSDHVCLITLNRPDALNAFDTAQRVELLDALCEATNNADVRAIVLTGAGRGFCAGADITDMSGRNVEDQLNAEYGAFLSVMQGGETPIIASINGPAAGIGMTLALTCDLRVIGQDAYLMSAFANIGLVPDGGLSWLLTQQIGYARAYEYAVEARKIGADRALDLGLVNRVVPTESVVDDALAWAGEIAQRAPLAMGLTKRSFRASFEHGLKNAMALEAMLQRTAIKTDDCREGVTALREKRAPVFAGK
ncbi:MAG: enoyl-CoA hydratase-related protein [Pseudomonadota bacterium]